MARKSVCCQAELVEALRPFDKLGVTILRVTEGNRNSGWQWGLFFSVIFPDAAQGSVGDAEEGSDVFEWNVLKDIRVGF